MLIGARSVLCNPMRLCPIRPFRFVGTAFIHAISNTLAVCNKNLEVELIPAAGVTIGAGAVVGGHPIEASGMVTTIKLGAVSLGQTKVKKTPTLPRRNSACVAVVMAAGW